MKTRLGLAIRSTAQDREVAGLMGMSESRVALITIAISIGLAAFAGAIIVPPVPGFYAKPRTVDDIVDFITGKILNLLGKKQALFKAWGE